MGLALASAKLQRSRFLQHKGIPTRRVTTKWNNDCTASYPRGGMGDCYKITL